MKTILIVEDNEQNRLTAEHFFETISGFKFLFASNRKEAEPLLLQADGVITDRSMPYETDGEEREVNGLFIAVYSEAMLEIPAIVITSHGDSFGGLGYVNKNESRYEEAKKQVVELFGKEYKHSHDHEFPYVVTIDFKQGWYPKTNPLAWKAAWEKLLERIQ